MSGRADGRGGGRGHGQVTMTQVELTVMIAEHVAVALAVASHTPGQHTGGKILPKSLVINPSYVSILIFHILNLIVIKSRSSAKFHLQEL
jgi:hypothetical protein